MFFCLVVSATHALQRWIPIGDFSVVWRRNGPSVPLFGQHDFKSPSSLIQHTYTHTHSNSLFYTHTNSLSLSHTLTHYHFLYLSISFERRSNYEEAIAMALLKMYFIIVHFKWKILCSFYNHSNVTHPKYCFSIPRA